MAQNVIAFITCAIENESGLMYFNLSSEYNLVSPTSDFHKKSKEELFSFLNTNNQTKASLWWGQSLLSLYWAWTSYQMETLLGGLGGTTDEDLSIVPRKGAIYFGRTESTSEDITDLLFFDIDYR
jgi:hypothetical protein